KLVRTSMRGRQRQWLLIKRDDAHAADLEADDLVGNSPVSKQKPASKKMAAKQKRPAPPRKATSIWHRRALALAGSADDAMPVDFQPELALLRAAPPGGDDWLHEIKWDGYRLLVDLVDGSAHLRSRGGLDWNETFPEVAKAIAALPVRDACLDGELVVLDQRGHSDFSALQRVIDGTSKASLQYRVFDLPGLAGVDLRGAPLLARKALLKQLLGRRKSLLGLSDHVIGHGAEVFAETGRQDIEGVVSKRIDSRYRAGRSGDWIKVKHEQADEFVVVGFTAPRGSRTAFGSLLMATREQGRLRYVGRVGSGFDDATLRSLHRRLQAIERKSATVELPEHVPFSARSVHWVKPVLVAEVAFRGWAKEGLLRQASFKRLRSDKPAAEVGPQRIEENSMQVTHPERRMFADCTYTKGDVAGYYRSVAKWMLPELSDRPLSLMRCPDGSQHECFFQKHHADTLGDAVHAVTLKQKSGSEQYLYIDSVEGMLDLVQMSTIEFHPWGSHIDQPEAPDRLVFDLDPGPGVSWPQVIAAARDVRGKLKQAGLQSFVRLSGGKGLHVVVPISRGPTWDDARGFCEAFAQAMSQHAPDTYIASMSKARRKGLIFLDWLRNTRGATSVASWSLRARSGAPVAVPLRWDELGRIKRPDAFDLAKAAQRARRLRKDPWAGFATLRQSLPR
ncbi:MAG TPA: DNA ligase D, partial [Rhodanobacter sp.]